jgi:Tfp pilus assembly protein PilN
VLDLRGVNPSSQPEQSKSTGVPGVGTNDVSFAPPPRRSSPILETGSNTPSGKEITGVASTKKDPVILVVAIVSVAVAGAAGLFASYLVGNQQKKLITKTTDYDTLVGQLHSSQTGKDLELIQTTAEQLSVLKSASTSLTPWVALLDALSGQTPGAIQLKSTAFDSSTKLLAISGNGTNYDDVARVIAALEKSERFSNVALQNAAASQIGTVAKVDFSIVATYLPTQPPVVAVPTATSQGVKQ